MSVIGGGGDHGYSSQIFIAIILYAWKADFIGQLTVKNPHV